MIIKLWWSTAESVLILQVQDNLWHPHCKEISKYYLTPLFWLLRITNYRHATCFGLVFFPRISYLSLLLLHFQKAGMLFACLRITLTIYWNVTPRMQLWKITHDGSWSCDMQAYKMMSEVLFLQILIVFVFFSQSSYSFVQANCNTAVYMAGSTTGVYEVHLTKSKEKWLKCILVDYNALCY